jgi:hypothetical protein
MAGNDQAASGEGFHYIGLTPWPLAVDELAEATARKTARNSKRTPRR